MGAVITTFISYWFAVHGSCLLLKPLRKTVRVMTKDDQGDILPEVLVIEAQACGDSSLLIFNPVHFRA